MSDKPNDLGNSRNNIINQWKIIKKTTTDYIDFTNHRLIIHFRDYT